MERLIEAVKDFVRKEDPLLWLSFFIASVISLLFFLFILIYVNILNPV